MRASARVLAVMVPMATAACGGGDDSAPKSPAHLAMSLDRGASGEILVRLELTDASGAPLSSPTPTLAVAGGSASALGSAGVGAWTATVMADAVDTEVDLTAAAGTATAHRTALALAVVDPAWGQPEAIEGLVNTRGWEDGANVSPDGQWLIVASYVPVDLFACASAKYTLGAPGCMNVIGPYAAPERPDMFGAERIHDGTYDAVCPDLGVTQPIGWPFFPTAAYGFKRQADGSFAEPFVMGFEADGCVGPYGICFAAPPSGGSAEVVFAYDDPRDSPDTHSDIFAAALALGEKNLFGRYQVTATGVELSDLTATKLPPVLPERQGNPAYGGGYLFWDDEDLAEADRDLYAAKVSGALPTITAGAPFTVGASQANRGEIQPFFDEAESMLYFMTGTGIHSAKLASPASDIASASSWSDDKPIVASGSIEHPILAIGEPTLARTPDATELYFVYIRKVDAGWDANVARVRRR